MRIAHVTATYPPYLGGAGTVCFHNARELAARGHEVHIFTAGMDGAPAYEVQSRVFVHRLRVLFRIGNMPVLSNLASILKDFDVIHLHYPFILGAELVSLGALLSKTPLVISFHNDLVGEKTRAILFRWYQNISARLTVSRAARLCVLSTDHFESSRLRRSLSRKGTKIVELPNGVDLDHFHPRQPSDQIRKKYGIPEHAKLVLFVAALDRAHHFKGLDILLNAVQELPSNIWLLAVGDGDLRKEYEMQAKDLGIANRVVFAGAVQHESLPAYFQSADVTVLPSLQTESFGLVLVESFACGTPVIATCLPGVRTVVDNGQDGLLVDPGSSALVTGTIQKLMADDKLRIAMGQRGRKKVEEKYGWRQIGARLEKIYSEVLQ